MSKETIQQEITELVIWKFLKEIMIPLEIVNTD
jgi:hypothetical protein